MDERIMKFGVMSPY